MPSITAKLASALVSVRRPFAFAVSGRVELLAPDLHVEGVGSIALPLLPVQARELVALAERAPFGRGAETLVDTEVRRTWQFAADRVRIDGRHWPRTLEDIVGRVADGLGIGDPIEAEFYKLLVYDEGSFFASHRDTEKADGMFATLVIVLPSQSEGGELVVRHGDREEQFDLSVAEPAEAAFAAFYADCVHEVLPIRSGYRVALVYNLMREGAPLAAPRYDGEQARVTSSLRSWRDDEGPTKIVYPLEHAYTPAALGFDGLKGADAGVAGVLAAAAGGSGVDLHLALFTIEESGWAEVVYQGSSWRHSSEDVFEVGEVTDRHVGLGEWRRPDGAVSPLADVPLADIPVSEDELSPPASFDEIEPDEQHFREATGNEGASFERTYSRAALVLWPRSQFFAVLCQAGLDATLPCLEDMVERWTADDGASDGAVRQEALDLAGRMVSDWPVEHWPSGMRQEPTQATRMLRLLATLKDTDLIRAFLGRIAAGGDYCASDNDAIVAVARLLSVEQSRTAIERIISGNVARSLRSCGNLLRRAAEAIPDAKLEVAARLVTGAVANPPEKHAFYSHERPDACFVVDLLAALDRIDPDLSDRTVGVILGRPAHYDVDGVLVPACCRLTGTRASQSAAVQRLLAACRAHLENRIARPLEAPGDWRRSADLICDCPDCAELGRFLDDPEREIWTFKAAKDRHGHVESTIRRSRSDVDVATVKRGSPHGLVCTKNSRSYEERVLQRKQDLENLATLQG